MDLERRCCGMWIKRKTLKELRDSQILYGKKMPNFAILLLYIIFLLLVGVTIWSIKNIKTYIVVSNGTVKSSNKNHVMSPYTGEIIYINIDEGKDVELGQTLFIVKSTELDIQRSQFENQRNVYENQLKQYEKLVSSIKDGENYFNNTDSEESLYYSQYETYKSQVEQNQIDISTLKAYGYSEEQINESVIQNQNKISEIYYSTIKAVEETIKECKTQIDLLDIQINAIGNGQEDYVVKANANGKIHMEGEYKKGTIVQATAPVASIASEGGKYEIEAYVNVADAARIKKGDTVNIAVSGLVEAVYGSISGTVTGKDSDVTIPIDGEKEAYFKVNIKPDIDYLINKRGDKVNLSNGMAVQTRIQYDKVTYFEYILDSLGILNR